MIELVPIKYNNNLSYSPKEENQFKKEGLTPLILKAFEHNHINVKHKHREKESEILFFENKQELYNSINKTLNEAPPRQVKRPCRKSFAIDWVLFEEY